MTPVITQYRKAVLGSRFSSPEDHMLDIITDKAEHWKTASILFIEILIAQMSFISSNSNLLHTRKKAIPIAT